MTTCPTRPTRAICLTRPTFPSYLHRLPFLEPQAARPRVDLHRVAFAEVTFEDAQRERIEDEALNRALQRPRAVARIVSLAHQLFLRGVGERHVNLPLLQTPRQPAQLDVDDLLHVLAP